MAKDITNVQKIVLGINYLGANGGAEVEALWKSRFLDNEVCLLQADSAGQPGAIFNQLVEELNRKKIQAGGKNCILVFFVDYTVEISKSIAALVWMLSDVLRENLGLNVEAVIQFAYVGRKGLDEVDVPRKNIKIALKQNSMKQTYENYRLCIVGKPALQNSESRHWKAAVVFVDLLRRSMALQDYLPVATDLGKNNICFLRYGEFRETDYQRLVTQKEHLDSLLANTGSSELNTLVDAKRTEMIREMERMYPVDGAMHPQHPDMIVEDPDGIILPWMTNTCRAAREGRNPAYNEAQSKTKGAVETTGIWLASQIKSWFDEQIDNAEQTLQKLFEDANVGIRLKLNPVQMRSALHMTDYPDPGPMPSLMLRYTEQGAAYEIGEYLSYIRNSGIREGIERYSKALIAAFEAIPQSRFEQQRIQLEQERNAASTALAEADDMEAFCQRIALENPPEAVFEIRPAMIVKNEKVLLCRNSVANLVDQKAALGSIPVLSVDEHLCGMAAFDDAPVKAVMIESIAYGGNGADEKDPVERFLDEILPRRKFFADFDFEFADMGGSLCL